MDSIVNKIRQFIKRITGQQPSQEDIFVQKLMQMLTHTREDELACEEVFEVIDLYAEAVERGEDVSEVMPLVQHHLEMCGHCHEEFEILKDMMQFEKNYQASSAA